MNFQINNPQNFDNEEMNIRLKANHTLDNRILIFSTETYYKGKDYFYPPQYILYNIDKQKTIVSKTAMNDSYTDVYIVDPSGDMSYISKKPTEGLLDLNINIYSSIEYSANQNLIRKYFKSGETYYIIKEKQYFHHFSIYNKNLEYVGKLEVRVHKEKYEIEELEN